MDEDKTKTTTSPSHIAYQVREGEDGKAYFNRVGSAFAHKDGQGLQLKLDSVPVDGRITLRTPKERLAEAGESKAKPDRSQGEREK